MIEMNANTMPQGNKVTVSTSELFALVNERNNLYKMLGSLIVMFKHEDKLKRHHRPYLHVRTEIDKMCDGYLKYLSELTNRDNKEIHVFSQDGNPCEPAMTKGEIIGCVDELVGDLITLLEYIEILRNFVNLLESGIEMEEVTAKFNRFLTVELDEMMERWEKHISECDHESE